MIAVETVVGDQTRPGRFKEPRGLALGSEGSIYVVEGGNHRIQRLTSDGGPLAILGGPGDGPGQLNDPAALAVDADGTLLVTDTGHGRVVRLAPDGTEVASWTASRGSSGKLVTPHGVAVAAEGSIYVSDPESRRIERYGRDGTPTGGWATEEPAVSLAMAGDGTIWSAERDAIGGAKTTFRGRIRRYSPTGETLVTLTTVTWPEMLTLAPDGTLVVSDNGHFLDNPFAARRLSPDGGEISRYGGQGPGRPPGGFGWAHGIVALADGRVIVADSAYDCLQMFGPSTESLGVWGVPRLIPTAMRADSAGGLVLVNRNDPRLHRVVPEGETAVIGQPPTYRPTLQSGEVQAAFGPDGRAYLVFEQTGELRRYAPDGALEREIRLNAIEARSASPIDGIAVDAEGRMFVTRTSSGRMQRLTADGQLESEWKAANGAARPEILAVGPSGQLYVGDVGERRVDRYSPDGDHLGMVIGPDSDGRKPRMAGIAVAPDDRLAVSFEAESRVNSLGEVADDALARITLVGPDGTPTSVSTLDLGLPRKTSFGAVAFDRSGALLVSAVTEARVLRLILG